VLNDGPMIVMGSAISAKGKSGPLEGVSRALRFFPQRQPATLTPRLSNQLFDNIRSFEMRATNPAMSEMPGREFFDSFLTFRDG
jgi:hypothetical protein